MKKYFSVLKIFMRNRFLTKLEYRGALWADLLFFLMGYGTQFLLIYIMIDKFGNIGGWSKYEVMLLYAMSILSYTLGCMFFRGVSVELSEKVREGHFDQTLTKPLNPLGYEIVSAFSGYYLVHVILGIVMVSIPFIMLDITLTPFKLILLVFSLIGGAMIQGGILILFSSASFYLIGDNPLVYNVFVTLRIMNETPISIYPRFVQIFLTVVIPFAFVSFYPSQYFLSKSDFLIFNPILQFLTPIVGLLTLSISGSVWLHGVNRYQSSGN